MDLEEIPVIHDRVNDVEHLIRLIRRVGHQPIERRNLTIRRVRRGQARRIVQIVRRQERQQLANERHALAVVVHGKMGDAARRVVRHRAAQLLFGHRFVRDRFDHVGPGHEHVARVPDHDDEVGNRRRVDGAAGARPHDGGDLRNDARGQRIPQENVGVPAEREHALLDPRTARVVQSDDGRAELHRQIHDLHDLRGVGFGQRPAEHREVLREGEHLPPVHEAVAGDNPVSRDNLIGHAEVAAAVRHQLVDLFERAGVVEQVDALAGGQLPGRVLALQAILSAPELGAALQIGQRVVTVRHTAFTACDFSQSFRNFSRPMVVSGWLNS